MIKSDEIDLKVSYMDVFGLWKPTELYIWEICIFLLMYISKKLYLFFFKAWEWDKKNILWKG